jgi:ParB-like chromosome segregation protein Spo0J
MKRKARIETYDLDLLNSFPAQEAMFDPLSDVDLAGLAQDIKSNGLKNPIEVLPKNEAGFPPGTIVRGHQRLRALRLNGESDADVLVRYDLADASRDRVEQEFLEDNLYRRQLDPLAKARVALRLAEIERQVPPGEISGDQEGEVRNRVGKVIGMSGRNLDRYWSLLKAPAEVQAAFRAGKLRLDVAAKVGRLDRKILVGVCRRLAEGEDPKAVVGRYVNPTKRVMATQADPIAALADRLTEVIKTTTVDLDSVGAAEVARHLDRLKWVRQQVSIVIRLGNG